MCKGEYLEFMLLFLRKTERGRANIRAKSDVLVAFTGGVLQITLQIDCGSSRNFLRILTSL